MSNIDNTLYSEVPRGPTSPEGYYPRPLVKQSRGARTSLRFALSHSPNNRAWEGYVTDGRTFGLDSNIYLKGIRWVKLFDWNNENDSTQKYSITTTTGITNTVGTETTLDVGISAAFKGIGLSFGASSKSFNSTEVSSSTSVTKEVTVDPKSHTYFYQKQYEFVTEKLYVVTDAAGDRVIYIRGTPTKTYSTQLVNADEYTTRKSEISGSTTGVINPTPVARQPFVYYDVDQLDPSSRTTFNITWGDRPNLTQPA